MESKFLISIIIPTRNRAAYAVLAVRQVLSIESEVVQVVVQDNSGNSALKDEIVAFTNDKRLKYNHTPELLSFVDNFSTAVALADGEYICMIGDDDGVNPEIIELVKWASKNNVKAIKPEVQAVYYWPEAFSFANNLSYSTESLTISEISCKVRIVDTSEEIKKLLKKGGQDYLLLDLVKLYHGIVLKKCMDEIRQITGSYFGGLSPDIYSSVALSVLIPVVICIDYPITIPGICNKSGSSDSATGRHTGDLKDAPHLVGHTNYNWALQVPNFYSVETIWADSTIAALKEMGAVQHLAKFNSLALAVTCYRKYSNYKKIILEQFIEKEKNPVLIRTMKRIFLYLALGVFPVIEIYERVLNRIRKGRISVVRHKKVMNILEAQRILTNHLTLKGVSISFVIEKLDRILLSRQRNF